MADKKSMYPEIQNNVQVRHPKFGLGKVLLRIGDDDNSKAIVRFQEEGEKKLALKFARLVRDTIEDDGEA
ncbi:MAG: hypothetical protein SF028_06315 [Candidatus Sumerlaeia bacterium]|nr:hypothetical protein [Candidatus Sumerlaeia bacterium]